MGQIGGIGLFWRFSGSGILRGVGRRLIACGIRLWWVGVCRSGGMVSFGGWVFGLEVVWFGVGSLVSAMISILL